MLVYLKFHYQVKKLIKRLKQDVYNMSFSADRKIITFSEVRPTRSLAVSGHDDEKKKEKKFDYAIL